MPDHLRIAMIGLDEIDGAELRDALAQLGHVSPQHASIRDVGALIAPVDIVFLSLRVVQDSGERVFNALPTAPIIIVRDVPAISIGQWASVWGHVALPFCLADVALALSIATGHFREVVSLQQEISELRSLLHDRKIIEKAKGIVMRQTNADEETAFKQMQKVARQRSRKLVEIAQGIIDSSAAVDAIKRRQGDV